MHNVTSETDYLPSCHHLMHHHQQWCTLSKFAYHRLRDLPSLNVGDTVGNRDCLSFASASVAPRLFRGIHVALILDFCVVFFFVYLRSVSCVHCYPDSLDSRLSLRVYIELFLLKTKCNWKESFDYLRYLDEVNIETLTIQLDNPIHK